MTHPDVQTAADACQRFADGWFRRVRPQQLILCGITGCGKTSMARAVAGWAMNNAVDAWANNTAWGNIVPSVAYRSWVKLASQLEKEIQIHEMLETFAGESLVILDDIGADTDRFKSGKATEALCALLPALESKWSILTTNVRPSQWRDRWDARVEDRLFRGNPVILDLNCPSFASV